MKPFERFLYWFEVDGFQIEPGFFMQAAHEIHDMHSLSGTTSEPAVGGHSDSTFARFPAADSDHTLV